MCRRPSAPGTESNVNPVAGIRRHGIIDRGRAIAKPSTAHAVSRPMRSLSMRRATSTGKRAYGKATSRSTCFWPGTRCCKGTAYLVWWNGSAHGSHCACGICQFRPMVHGRKLTPYSRMRCPSPLSGWWSNSTRAMTSRKPSAMRYVVVGLISAVGTMSPNSVGNWRDSRPIRRSSMCPRVCGRDLRHIRR